MCSLFRSRGRGNSRELKRGNSVRELACNNPRGSRCPETRTNLLFFTFLFLRGKRGLRRCFSKSSAAETLLKECLTVQRA